jgi:hypothetical protein
MRKIPLAEIVLNFTLYPRRVVDGQHVHYLREAIRAGATLPPLVVWRKGNQLVDGFHRHAAYKAEGIEEVEAVEKDYANEKTAFLDSIRFNACHGRRLDSCDRTHCLLRSEELHIEPTLLASAMNITVDALGELRATKVGQMRATPAGGPGLEIPLKHTIRHMAGRTLTKDQAEANQGLGGMNQLFYVNQVLLLIENGLVDTDNERLEEGLRHLAESLNKYLSKIGVGA